MFLWNWRKLLFVLKLTTLFKAVNAVENVMLCFFITLYCIFHLNCSEGTKTQWHLGRYWENRKIRKAKSNFSYIFSIVYDATVIHLLKILSLVIRHYIGKLNCGAFSWTEKCNRLSGYDMYTAFLDFRASPNSTS